jgi:hypothetical protein
MRSEDVGQHLFFFGHALEQTLPLSFDSQPPIEFIPGETCQRLRCEASRTFINHFHRVRAPLSDNQIQTTTLLKPGALTIK